MSRFRSSPVQGPRRVGHRRVGLTLIAALLLSACGPSPDAMLDSAKSFVAKNDLNAASIQLKNALQENGDLAEARFLLGKINLEQGNVAGAVKELQHALQLGYSENEALPLLVTALVASGEFDRALKDYEGKVVNDPAAQAKILTAFGAAYLGKADIAAAQKAYTAALQLDKHNVPAGIGLGRAQLFAGDPAAAKASAEAIIADDAKAGEAYLLLADARLALGDADRKSVV